MRLSALPNEAEPSPTSYKIIVRDNGDGTFTDVKVPIKNSYYKEYNSNVTQATTAAPTATEFVNTVGAAAWTRQTTGTFRITKVGGFPITKRQVFIGAIKDADGANGRIVESDTTPSDDFIEFYCYDASGSLSDNITNIPIRIVIQP